MKRLLALFLFFFLAASGWAQVLQPNLSQKSDSVTASGRQTDILNTGAQAIAWRLTWWYTGFTAVTAQIDCAPDNGSGSAGTYAACGGAFDGTSNPQAISATPQGGTVAVKTFSPHVAVNFTSVTGSGKVHYLMTGYVGTNVSPSTVTTSGGGGTQNVDIVGPLGQGLMAASIPVAIASDQSAVPVTTAGNGTVLSAQQSVTGSAVALATNTVKSVCVKAAIANTINVYIGPTGISTSTGFELTPGAGACLAVTNTNLVFVIASTTGASVSWIASN